MEPENKLFARCVIYEILLGALVNKSLAPPEGWSAARLDEEVYLAGKDYEPDLYLRHRDALCTSVFYLVDFARRMPERVNLSRANRRVRELCGELADEIEQITYEPDAVINRHGKLKIRLNAILSVQTCLIYREETARHIAEADEAKRLSRLNPPHADQPDKRIEKTKISRSSLARAIFQKVAGRAQEDASAQPSLF